MLSFQLCLLLSSVVSAFPFVANQPGVDSSVLSTVPAGKRQTTCPFNPVHKGAAPYSSKFPYSGAKNGLPGTGKGGIKVPSDGDTAHAFTAPGPNDIRGPCPGLNAAANHNFLSHDGITTFTELVDMQQNVFNVGYDLAVFLATIGIALTGDVTTAKMSIGCDATSRTALLPLLGSQPGLNGHNKFEGDTSLTRNDYDLGAGDDFTFNGTLFANMVAVAKRTSGGVFDRATIAAYRSQRYDESLSTNPQFMFGPFSLLQYGGASFVYELIPSYGNEGVADLATVSTFFGASPDAASPGGYKAVPERIPQDWYNRRASYTNNDVSLEILAQYLAYPKLFGGNVGKADNFNAMSSTFGVIEDGKIPDSTTAVDLVCLLYQLGTQPVPSSLGIVTDLAMGVLNFVLDKLNPVFANSGCVLK